MQSSLAYFGSFILLFHYVYSNCCHQLDQAQGRCISCPGGMHLYRGNCLFNIKNCLAYEKGFDCNRCQDGYNIVKTIRGTLCEKIQNISQLAFTSLPLADEALAELNDLTYSNFQQLGDDISAMNLEEAFKANLKNMTFYKLIYSFTQGIFFVTYQLSSVVSNSKKVEEKIIIELKNEKFLNESDPFTRVIKQNVQRQIQLYYSKLQKNRYLIASKQNRLEYRVLFIKNNGAIQDELFNLGEGSSLAPELGFGEELIFLNNLQQNQNRFVWNILSKYQQYLRDANITYIGKKKFLRGKTLFNITYNHLSILPQYQRKSKISFEFDSILYKEKMLELDLARLKFPLSLNPDCSLPSDFPIFYNISFETQEIIQIRNLRQTVICAFANSSETYTDYLVHSSQTFQYLVGFNGTTVLHNILLKYSLKQKQYFAFVLLKVDVQNNNSAYLLSHKVIQISKMKRLHVNDLNREKELDLKLYAKTMYSKKSQFFPSFKLNFDELQLFSYISYTINRTDLTSSRQTKTIREKYQYKVPNKYQFVQFQFEVTESVNSSEEVMLFPPMFHKSNKFQKDDSLLAKRYSNFVYQNALKFYNVSSFECDQNWSSKKNIYRFSCFIEILSIGYKKAWIQVNLGQLALNNEKVSIISVENATQIPSLDFSCSPFSTKNCEDSDIRQFIEFKENNTFLAVLSLLNHLLSSDIFDKQVIYLRERDDEKYNNTYRLTYIQIFQVLYGKTKGFKKRGMSIIFGITRLEGELIVLQTNRDISIGEYLIEASKSKYKSLFSYKQLIPQAPIKAEPSEAKIPQQKINLQLYILPILIFQIISNTTFKQSVYSVQQISNSSGLLISLPIGIQYSVFQDEMPLVKSRWKAQSLQARQIRQFYIKLASRAIKEVLRTKEEMNVTKISKKSFLDQYEMVWVLFKTDDSVNQFVFHTSKVIFVSTIVQNKKQARLIEGNKSEQQTTTTGLISLRAQSSFQTLPIIPINFTSVAPGEFLKEDSQLLAVKQTIQGFSKSTFGQQLKINRFEIEDRKAKAICEHQIFGQIIISVKPEQKRTRRTQVDFVDKGYYNQGKTLEQLSNQKLSGQEKIVSARISSIFGKMSVLFPFEQKIQSQSAQTIKLVEWKYKKINGEVGQMRAIYNVSQSLQINVTAIINKKLAHSEISNCTIVHLSSRPIENISNQGEQSLLSKPIIQIKSDYKNVEKNQNVENLSSSARSTLKETQASPISINKKITRTSVDIKLQNFHLSTGTQPRKTFRTQIIQQITSMSQFIIAQQLLFSQYGFYIPNKYVVDILYQKVFNEHYFTIRYPGPKGNLTLQAHITFNFDNKKTRILSLTVMKPVPPLIKIVGCSLYREDAQICLGCEPGFVEKEGVCYVKVLNCSLQQKRQCKTCEEGKKLFEGKCV